MRIRFFLPFAVVLLLVACKQDPTANTATATPLSDTPNSLGGAWIAIDFCSRVEQYGSVLQAEFNTYRPYAFAMVFNSAKMDSVHCFNGFEDWKVPIKINQDTVELVGASQGKSIFLIYDSQSKKYFSMYDGTNKAGTQIDRFLKSTVPSEDGHLAFSMSLNHHLLRGSFSPIAVKGTDPKVLFLPEGFVKGWPQYDTYQVCVGGDCFVMGNEMDIITLSDSKKAGSEKMFAFKYSNQNDTLSIFNIADATPNEKGGYVSKGVAYRFLRKIPTR